MRKNYHEEKLEFQLQHCSIETLTSNNKGVERFKKNKDLYALKQRYNRQVETAKTGLGELELGQVGYETVDFIGFFIGLIVLTVPSTLPYAFIRVFHLLHALIMCGDVISSHAIPEPALREDLWLSIPPS